MALTGCSSAVQVAAPTPVRPSGTGVPVNCTAVMRLLPTDLNGQRRRTTAPDPDGTAAWGDPAMTLRCPVATPRAYAQTSQLVVVNGVGWLAEPQPDGVRFTAMQVRADTAAPIALSQYVELNVPSAYAPEAESLPALAQAVDAGAGLPAQAG